MLTHLVLRVLKDMFISGYTFGRMCTMGVSS